MTETPTQAAVPPITGVHHLTLTVRDVDASAAWYQEVLGFELFAAIPDTAGRGEKRILQHPASGLMVGLTAHQAGDGSPFSEFRTGLDHLAFAVPDREQLDAWVARLDAAGVAHSPVAVGAVGHVVTFRDPDNIQLELYA